MKIYVLILLLNVLLGHCNYWFYCENMTERTLPENHHKIYNDFFGGHYFL